jgi:P4 family phage/plasmid primase-like protien
MAYEQLGFYFRHQIPKEDGGVKLVDVPQYKLMADHCFDKKNMCFDDSTSLRFDGKKWDWFSKTSLANFIIEENNECIKPAHLDGFVKMIRGKCLASVIATKESDGLINVNNGIIDVKSGQLLPHSHEYLFKYCSPVDFNPKAECPRWEQFLVDTFQGNIDLIDLAQRLFGYVLIGGRPFLHKAFVLYGSGRNGKSTFLDILRAALGRDSYSVVSMAKIDKEFSVVMLDGKLANIVEETPTDEINAEAFKNLVGGGEVVAAHKGMDEYSFQCNARFVFACNEMPVFKDRSVGLEERLVFIPFNRYLKEEERDTEITEKLLAELPGIFNWAIEGAKIMLKDRKLPKYQSTSDAKEVYRQETDPLYAWFTEEIEIDALAEEVTVRETYGRYCDACQENGNKPYSKDKFSKRFRTILRKKCEEQGVKFESDLRDKDRKSRVFNVIRFRTPWTARSEKVSDKKSSANGWMDS